MIDGEAPARPAAGAKAGTTARGGLRRLLLPTAGYVLLALVFTWPMPLSPAASIILERGSDAWLHLWDLWWVRFAVVDLGQNPYFTNYLLYPSGLPLTYHSLDLLNALLSIPLQPFGLLLSFNLLVLLNLIITGLAACWLIRLLGAGSIAAFLGGALFVLTPINSTSVNLAQLDEVTMAPIPLYAGLLIRAGGLRAAGIPAGGWGYVAAAGVALAASALATWYFTAGLVLLTGVYVLWETLWRLRERGEIWQPLIRSASTGVVFLLLLSPLLAAMIGERLSGATWMLPALGTTIYNSADLLAFFVPLPARLDWSVLYPHGSNVAIGWSALALLGAALLLSGSRERRRLWLWLLAAAILLVFALGPQLKVGGVETGLPAPYALLNNVPFVGASRQPLRYSACLALCVAILAAFGLDLILKRVAPRRAVITLTLVAVLILVEYVPAGRPLIAPAVPAALRALSDAEAQGGTTDAVLELPYEQWGAVAMYHQTAHERPIVGGYTSRKYPYPFAEQAPGVAQLLRYDAAPLIEDDILVPSVADTALAAMDYYGVRTVVVHPLEEGGRGGALRAVLDALFERPGVSPRVVDDLQIYTVPRLDYDGPIAGLGEGWHALEHGAENSWRWTAQDARLLLINTAPDTRRYRLELDVYAFEQQRTLAVTVDGREVAREPVPVPPGRTIALELEVAPGDHVLQLSSLEPAKTPAGDRRELALGYWRVEIRAVGAP